MGISELINNNYVFNLAVFVGTRLFLNLKKKTGFISDFP